MISAIFILVTKNNQKVILERVFYIWYLVQFQKDKDNIKALLDLSSKINAMNLLYTKKLGFQIRQTDIGAQKIDKSYLNMFEIVIVGFLL